MPLKQKIPACGPGLFSFLYVCYRILVPALTVKVKVVAIKKCGVKSHVFVIVW